eukprot:gnl/TRDRNA2_/TRDRNA2_91577_c0_seq1.p1 gnl/TRDRNA2_/TRDRNA2_91577_c0~~gnl/TRDRNA2_/TRDRNA2_91577_c0_seq1.p1  ORF type:complete len:346 (-),score=32.53 gnl/TRDRNA2_/TRDRNA2_91577_c0_seq1:64-1026(-)
MADNDRRAVVEEQWDVWKPVDVSRWMSEVLELPQYAAAFLDNGVDGPTLSELTEETLEDPLCVTEVIHRKKIIGHIKLLKIRSSWNIAGSALANHAVRSSWSCQEDPQFAPMHASAAGSQVKRARSTGAVIERKAPRSASSTASTLESPRSRSVKTLAEDMGSMYSCFTNPDTRSIAGLSSLFGLDSPSFSRRGGNFNRSPRSQDIWGVQGLSSVHSYQASDVDRLLRCSPRATIGRSPRRTDEYLIRSGSTPGVGKYNPDGPRGRERIKGGSFTQARRMHYDSSTVKTWLSPAHSPGPAHYRPLHAFDSSFSRVVRGSA